MKDPMKALLEMEESYKALLFKYRTAQTSVIYEFSGNSKRDIAELQEEIDYREVKWDSSITLIRNELRGK